MTKSNYLNPCLCHVKHDTNPYMSVVCWLLFHSHRLLISGYLDGAVKLNAKTEQRVRTVTWSIILSSVDSLTWCHLPQMGRMTVPANSQREGWHAPQLLWLHHFIAWRCSIPSWNICRVEKLFFSNTFFCGMSKDQSKFSQFPLGFYLEHCWLYCSGHKEWKNTFWGNASVD